MSDKLVKTKRAILPRPVPAERRWIITRLEEIRGLLGLPDEQFARQHLDRSYTVWFRVKQNNYTGNVASVLDAYERNIRILEDMLAVRALAAPKVTLDDIFTTRTVQAVFNAVTAAMERTDNKKLVFVLAHHGQGKSTICELVRNKFGAHVAFATQSWSQSYFAGCAAVNNILGDSGPWRGTYEVENALWKNLSERCKVLCIDNANTFGPHTCNMVRDALDITGRPIVIFSLPHFFDKLRNDAHWQSAQMIRRAVVIEAKDIIPEEAAHILRNCGLNGSGMDAAQRVTVAANKFAHYGFVHAVREYLQEKYPSGATIDQVNKAISYVTVSFRQHKQYEGRGGNKEARK